MRARKQTTCGHADRRVVADGLCQTCYTRRWRANNQESDRRKRKDYNLRKCYGISIEVFDALYESQDGRCVLCLKKFIDEKSAHVDHCHDSGRVRGLLCYPCNKALGQLGDSKESIRRVLAYVDFARIMMGPATARTLSRAGIESTPLMDWRLPLAVSRAAEHGVFVPEAA